MIIPSKYVGKKEFRKIIIIQNILWKAVLAIINKIILSAWSGKFREFSNIIPLTL